MATPPASVLGQATGESLRFFCITLLLYFSTANVAVPYNLVSSSVVRIAVAVGSCSSQSHSPRMHQLHSPLPSSSILKGRPACAANTERMPVPHPTSKTILSWSSEAQADVNRLQTRRIVRITRRPDLASLKDGFSKSLSSDGILDHLPVRASTKT